MIFSNEQQIADIVSTLLIRPQDWIVDPVDARPHSPKYLKHRQRVAFAIEWHKAKYITKRGDS